MVAGSTRWSCDPPPPADALPSVCLRRGFATLFFFLSFCWPLLSTSSRLPLAESGLFGRSVRIESYTDSNLCDLSCRHQHHRYRWTIEGYIISPRTSSRILYVPATTVIIATSTRTDLLEDTYYLPTHHDAT